MNALTAAQPRAEAVSEVCAHCGLPVAAGCRFCCSGCEAAHGLIEQSGLGRYYRDRVINRAVRPLTPEIGNRPDLAVYCQVQDGITELTLAVEGLQCGACVWLIESVLARAPGLISGRVNMGSCRLRLAWHGSPELARGYADQIEALGYRLIPYDPAAITAARDKAGQALLRALAVAGFAAGNVMLLALACWVGPAQGMGPATRALLSWLAALIAMPAIAYSGLPFFASAFAALRHGRTNMDVPVSLGVLAVTGLSVWQAMVGGAGGYFESATMLLFFLLLGRVLDHRARMEARGAAERLLALRATDVGILQSDGRVTRCRLDEVTTGDRVVLAMGERLGVDGIVLEGRGAVDASLVTGESLPAAIGPGDRVFAGTLNMGPVLTVQVTAVQADTLLAECVRLIEAAEAARGRYRTLADRVARLYAPVVHLCALLTLLFWLWSGVDFARAVLAACAVLIITCPCALGLAIPVVQLILTGRLFVAGTLLKTPAALERLASVDTVCFDKTGTLTEPELSLASRVDPVILTEAAGLAACSRHPLARALAAAAGRVPAVDGVREFPGEGLSRATEWGEVRLGSAAFCGMAAAGEGTELWFARPGREPVRFGFSETLRSDAAETVTKLQRMGMTVRLLSGDRPSSVARVARQAGISDFRAECRPDEKAAAIARWQAAGATVLMVGDGLNDGPCLAAAAVSAAPASAADVSQTLADIVFQGSNLRPVWLALHGARRGRRIVQQNLAMAAVYNLVMVPFAMSGLVTPWLAAAAMSGSSLAVVMNGLRARRIRA